MRYVIIGAGAVGGIIGGLLACTGRDVVLVARGAHLDAIRATGLQVATPAGARTVHPPAVADPAELDLRADDLLVLAVKSQDTAAALAVWAERPVAGGRTAGEDLLIVCAQNGVDNERAALRRFDHVAGMCVWLPATFLEPGRVSAVGDPVVGVLTLGHVPPSSPLAGPGSSGGSGSDPLAVLAADLEQAGFLAPVVDEVMRWKYAKLLTNLGNAVEALCGRDPGAADLTAAAVEEARAVLDAAGIDVADDAELATMRAQYRTGVVPGSPRTGGSTWQSLQRGAGSVEVDHLNGEIAMLGRLHGVPTPVNATLQRLADRAAAASQGPGSRSASEVLAAIAAATAASTGTAS